MPDPEGFDYELRASEVVVSHRGTRACTLRGAAVARFLRDLEAGGPQQVMARVSGNYRRGNERLGKSHPRNR